MSKCAVQQQKSLLFFFNWVNWVVVCTLH